MGTPQQPSLPFQQKAEPRPPVQDPHSTENSDIRRHLSNRIGLSDTWYAEGFTNNVDFADELADTARYFVQHALVTIIFVLKLCALPLVYLVQLLAGSRDWPRMVAASFPQSPSAILGRVTTRDSKDTTLRPLLAYIIDAVILPFRMTRTLYKICNLLQQHPEVLTQLGSRNIRAPEANGAYNLETKNRRVVPTASIVGAPFPTEVYHAALSECGDLNEVLAAFDLDSSSHESLLDDREGRVTEDARENEQLRSLQNTPPEMHRSVQKLSSPPPMKITPLHPNGFACFDSVSHKEQESGAPSSIERVVYTPKVWDRMDDQRHMSMPEKCVGHDMKKLLGDTDALERCPTYVRRHRRSLLPRRLGMQSALNLGYGSESQETLPIGQNPPQKKGARLKKKRLVKTNNSSMTSLLRRF